jgi:hypothetical protein
MVLLIGLLWYNVEVFKSSLCINIYLLVVDLVFLNNFSFLFLSRFHVSTQMNRVVVMNVLVISS